MTVFFFGGGYFLGKTFMWYHISWFFDFFRNLFSVQIQRFEISPKNDKLGPYFNMFGRAILWGSLKITHGRCLFWDSFTFRMPAHSSKFTSLVCSDIALRDLLKSLLFSSGVHFLRTLRCGERFAFFSSFFGVLGRKWGILVFFAVFWQNLIFRYFLFFWDGLGAGYPRK